MKKHIATAALLLALVMLAGIFSACGLFNGSVVGTWVEIKDDGSKGDTYTFARNGKGSVSSNGIGGEMTWTTQGNVLSITVSICGVSETKEFYYSVRGKTMTLTNISDSRDVVILKKK